MTDDEVKSEVCRRLIEGESLRSICSTDGMRDKATLFRWLAVDDEFRRKYAAARDLQAERLADEIIEIADTPVIGTKIITKADGTVERTEADMIEHRRLQVDARKWIASKLAPKKYGDSTMLKHADADGNKLPELSEHELCARAASMI